MWLSSPARRWNKFPWSVALVAAGAACTDATTPSLPTEAPNFAVHAAPAPIPLVTLVATDDSSTAIWPYTGADFSGTPQDPVNLIFAGKPDPRALRAILFGLSGDRTAFGFPNVAPFNCRWSDAIGDLQTAYRNTTGWTGSAIQLQCGDYGPVRFHLRLFGTGPVTLGAAHFELLIPGIADHQVISWELAEQLVTVDLVRSGLLAASPTTTGRINASPFRAIPAVLYNGIPPALRAAIHGPLGDVSDTVPIGTDGRATMLTLARTVAPRAGIKTQAFTIDFNQVIPKPFCGTGPLDLIHVAGPVELRKRVQVTASGDLRSDFEARGRLVITPIDAATGAPAGPSYAAEIREHQTTSVTDRESTVRGFVLRSEVPPRLHLGRLMARLDVGPRGHTQFDQSVDCAP